MPGALLDELSSVDQGPLVHIQYACCYWVYHLAECLSENSRDVSQYNEFLSDEGIIKKFLLIHLLHWLEALGWMGKTSEGMLAISSLEAQIPVTPLHRLGNHD